ncbi:hypothetical protein FRC06_011698 [Ceratobasidium sp. 370]|nr:hypothetical protein FRC06_011698 [Ceratobasidium sp. 370]
MDESESEDEDQAEVDEGEDEDEKEPDLRMLRRRLREHRCKWQGCVGPAVLSSAELLGVHLNKKHPPRRDASRYFTCWWGDCRMQFKRGKDLWEHMSDEHIIRPLWCPYQNCARAAADRYQLDTHVRRKHRGRPDHELRPLARPEECAIGEQVLRPSAFPPGVPYFRIMGMALAYNVLPARVSPQWHARNGPKVLRMISSTMSPVRAPAQYVPLEPRPNVGASSPGGSLLAFGSPTPARMQVRLSTVPLDVLGEELEIVEMLAPRSSSDHSPARSHITVHSDDETPEREVQPLRRGGGRPPLAARGRGSRGRGRGRGRSRGGSLAGGNLGERNLAPHGSTAGASASRDPSTPTDVSTPTLASTSSVPTRAAPTPAAPRPRLQMVVELPSSQGRKQRM